MCGGMGGGVHSYSLLFHRKKRISKSLPQNGKVWRNSLVSPYSQGKGWLSNWWICPAFSLSVCSFRASLYTEWTTHALLQSHSLAGKQSCTSFEYEGQKPALEIPSNSLGIVMGLTHSFNFIGKNNETGEKYLWNRRRAYFAGFTLCLKFWV